MLQFQKLTNNSIRARWELEDSFMAKKNSVQIFWICKNLECHTFLTCNTFIPENSLCKGNSSQISLVLLSVRSNANCLDSWWTLTILNHYISVSRRLEFMLNAPSLSSCMLRDILVDLCLTNSVASSSPSSSA